MIDVPPEVKEEVIKDLRAYFLNSALKVGTSNDNWFWFITAFSPAFLSILEAHIGEDASLVADAVGKCSLRFAMCLLDSITLTLSEDKPNFGLLMEFLDILDLLSKKTSEEKFAYIQSLDVSNAEQELPEFLQAIVNRMYTLVGDYVLAFVEGMEHPSDEVVTEFLSRCKSPEEIEELKAYFKQVDERAEELLADEGTSENDLLNGLIAFASSIFDPEQ